jgi:hypothetical protein
MNKETVTKILNILLAVSGMLLIVWWLLVGLQWLTASDGSLATLVLTPSWLPINIVGLLSCLLLILGLTGILTGTSSVLGTFGFVGIAISVSGAALFTALQFDEAFMWPLLAVHAEEFLEIDGPMFSDPAFSSSYLVMGVLFAVGFVLLALQSLRRRIFPVIPSLFLLVGSVLFAGGILIPAMIRTVGVILFGTALIWIGFRNSKSSL